MPRNIDYQKAIWLGLLGAAAIFVLNRIAQNPRLNPNLRLLAKTTEGDVVQDLTTGLVHLLV
jgi:hypothetical protein